jgi:RNA polymerase sigma-70 factor (ECF subfamily)
MPPMEQESPQPEVVPLLRGAAAGDARAEAALTETVYREMHRIAAAIMGGERRQVTMQATSLAHEAWLRLLGGVALDDRDVATWRRRFAATCRRVLVDLHRQRVADKRGGGAPRVGLETATLFADATRPVDVLDLHEALERLQRLHPLAAAVAEMRFFGDLTMPQVAEQLGVGLRTAEKAWTSAKAYLHGALRP